VIITEIYETESLEVSFAPGSSNPSMTVPRLRQLLGETRWRADVFACLSIRDRKSADIELMNADSKFNNFLKLYKNLFLFF
jgi:hypothetical protein